MRYWLSLVLMSMLAGCGGATASAPAHRPDDEVSATWTSGDDAPLGDAPQKQ